MIGATGVTADRVGVDGAWRAALYRRHKGWWRNGGRNATRCAGNRTGGTMRMIADQPESLELAQPDVRRRRREWTFLDG
jgi:hypothetical protein